MTTRPMPMAIDFAASAADAMPPCCPRLMFAAISARRDTIRRCHGLRATMRIDASFSPCRTLMLILLSLSP